MKPSSGVASSICNAMHIPHIITHWTPESMGGFNAPNAMTLNVYPDSNVLSRAFADMIVANRWKSFTVLYDTDEGEDEIFSFAWLAVDIM